MAEEYKGKIQFFGTAWHATEQECREFVEEFNVPYPTGLDKTEKVFRAYGFSYQPNTVAVTRSGSVFKKVVGEMSKAKLKRLLDEVLAAA